MVFPSPSKWPLNPEMAVKLFSVLVASFHVVLGV